MRIKKEVVHKLKHANHRKHKMLLIFVSMLLFSCTSSQQESCSISKDGTFKYLDNIGDPSAYFVIRGEKHIEYHRDNQWQIESRVTWINDFEYETELIRTNYESLPFKRGDKLRVKVNKVMGDTVYLTATVNEQLTWESTVLKMKE